MTICIHHIQLRYNQNKNVVDSQRIDAAEVLNSIAQLTPISRIIPTIQPPITTTLTRPATLPLNPSSKLYNLTQVPPPLRVLKPNGIQDHLNKADSVNPVGGVQFKGKDKMTIQEDPILNIPSLPAASNSTVIITTTATDNLGPLLPLVRVPPALPTITISLPSTSQLVKQELPLVEKNSVLLSTTASHTSNHVLLPSIPLPPPKNVSKKLTSLRPTTLNIPKPLTVPTILMPKETLASNSSSLLSLANVSAVQNHLPVLPPPTRHHLQGVSSISSCSSSNHINTNANLVPSSSTTTVNKNANNCAIGPSGPGLPAGLTITANTIIKQEIPHEDISSLAPTVILNASSTNLTSNVNGNQQTKQNRKKSGKTKSGPILTTGMKNGPNNNVNIEHEQKSEEDDDDDDEDNVCNYMDLSGLSNEERRKILRRQRNKEAAARCRKRRLDQTLGLQEQVDQWIENRNELQREINELQNQETELQNMLSLHQLTNCKIKDNTKLIKNSIVTTLEREAAPIGGGLGRLAAVAAAVSNSMKMAKKVEESSQLSLDNSAIKKSSSTNTRKTNL